MSQTVSIELPLELRIFVVLISLPILTFLLWQISQAIKTMWYLYKYWPKEKVEVQSTLD